MEQSVMKLVVLSILFFASTVSAETIHLISGRSFAIQGHWEQNGTVCFFVDGKIQPCIDKKLILRIDDQDVVASAPVRTVADDKPEMRKAVAGTDKVFNSGFDGSVRQIEDYLKKTLNDPFSVKFESWGEVMRFETGPCTYMAWCRYRAKNAYGGYVLTKQTFCMDANGVVVHVSQ